MPELPEVETTRRVLEPHLVGRTFTGAVLDWPKAVAHPDPATFAERLAGRRVTGLDRRGKHLIIALDGGSRLIVHLRMTGSLQFGRQDAPLPAYTRNRLLLDGGDELRFVDLRKFGQLWLFAPGEAARLPYDAAGPEPFDAAFTPEDLAARLQKRRTNVKAALLDQHVLAGLGNIYADEALFAAAIHPERRADTLTDEEIQHLHAAILAVLRQGVANLGTSYRDFVGPFMQRGNNLEQLQVWRREGKPCPRCGAPIVKQRVAGRGTHLCPNCQRLETSVPSAG